MSRILFATLTTLLLTIFSLSAQTRVEKKVATKANRFGITYSLPKTTLVIHARVTKHTCKAGPYFRYAAKYLGEQNAVTENETYYELDKVTLKNKGIPDPDNTYVVEFKAGTTAPYAFLTEDGLLCSINAEYTPPIEPTDAAVESAAPLNTARAMTEELLMAGSVARQADIAAKQIYRIRESRMDILTGDADNLPPDGEAMKLVIAQLEQQEKALTQLFTGVCSVETLHHEVVLTPLDDIENETIFRFSRKLGVLEADDLGGDPINLSLKAIERAPQLDPKEAEKKEKSLKGIIYNVPGKAKIEIKQNDATLCRAEVQVTQFGTVEGLAPIMFEDRKAPVKIYFYPETGAIRQIIQ